MKALVINQSITRRDEKSLEKYLADISKFDVLSPEQELILFKQLRDGDQSTLTKIVTHNLRFVVSVAKQYQNMGLALGDLINEGNIGLIKAARRFDESRGFKFISYAVWWVRQSILQALNERSRKIRLPSNQQAKNLQVKRKRDELLQKSEREPSEEELSFATGLSESEITSALMNYSKCRSLDAPTEADSDFSLSNLLEDKLIPEPDHELNEIESRQIRVQEILKTLNSREATVLRFYFGLDRNNPMSLDEIGNHYGVTRERVRQIKDRALLKLRRKEYRKEFLNI